MANARRPPRSGASRAAEGPTPRLIDRARASGEVLLAPVDATPTAESAGMAQAIRAPGVETVPNAADFSGLPPRDDDWTDEHWRYLIEWLLRAQLFSARELASLVLGHLNPSQVGTSIASKKTFQAHYPPRKTMAAVLKWHMEQTGKCLDCNTRLELQADHIETREDHGDDADRLENMTLRCRRCNVIRRPSHRQGGRTHLTAEAALMWILFVKRPRTYQAYEVLCRSYGMTMANIRFKEAWAMARWLSREGLYEIDLDSSM